MVHRGAFCQFHFRWIYYYGSDKSTGKETGKRHLCGVFGSEYEYVVMFEIHSFTNSIRFVWRQRTEGTKLNFEIYRLFIVKSVRQFCHRNFYRFLAASLSKRSKISWINEYKNRFSKMASIYIILTMSVLNRIF